MMAVGSVPADLQGGQFFVRVGILGYRRRVGIVARTRRQAPVRRVQQVGVGITVRLEASRHDVGGHFARVLANGAVDEKMIARAVQA